MILTSQETTCPYLANFINLDLYIYKFSEHPMSPAKEAAILDITHNASVFRLFHSKL